MEKTRLVLGTSVMVMFSSAVGYFAQYHRPFSDGPYPFTTAYLATMASLTVIIFLTRWFAKGEGAAAS